ncbi:MAG: MarR family transcriptional regulator [Microbacteriaceae bacterium]|nr:MarR family transcriptional regulator [Microbacteriaceae bacterium]
MMDSGRGRITREQLSAWRSYLETADNLRALLESRLQESSKLSLGDYSVLLALSEAIEHKLRSSELATRINWTRSRLSHHLGRMERRGLITRVACLDDSRGTEAVLTSAGAEAFRRGSVAHLQDVRELFIEAFTAEQLESVASIAYTLRSHLDALQDSPDSIT